MVSTGIRGGIVVIGVAAAITAAGAPLRAEDGGSIYAALFQSLRQQERFAGPRMGPRPYSGSYSPYQLDHRFTGRPRRTVRDKRRDLKDREAAKPTPDVAPKPAQVPSNPHLALMTDRTLRPGDIVMFPDGPRVFRGEPGDRHQTSDFVQVDKAKGLTQRDRKYLTALRTGVNEAWVETSEATKVAGTLPDVQTTGSVSERRSRR